MPNSRKPSPTKATTSDRKGLTLDGLPPRHNVRWNNKLKQLVVDAVESGLISLWDASDRYRLSIEEYFTWKRASNCNAAPAQRTKRSRSHRQIQFRRAA